jgi:hypothetical protein
VCFGTNTAGLHKLAGKNYILLRVARHTHYHTRPPSMKIGISPEYPIAESQVFCRHMNNIFIQLNKK